MKIVLYGTCSFPYFYRDVIKQADEKKMPHAWRVIALSWRHLPLFENILPPEHVFYVAPPVNALMKEPLPDLDILKDYSGSIVKDIAADKNHPGQLKRRPSTYQMKSAVAYYRVYKEYLLKEKPDCVFSPIIESHDGLILFAVARELGIPMAFVTSSRNLRLSIFSPDPYETLPSYVMESNPPASIVERAEQLIKDFQKAPFKAVGFTYTPKPEEVIMFPKFIQGHKKLGRIPRGFWNLYKDSQLEPHAARPNPLWYQPREQFAAVTRRITLAKAEWRRKYQDITTLEALPKKFFYMPLHVYPELTITTMAPFYEDQLRAVDLIRFSMPADHRLLIKEHPMMKGRRPSAFYEALGKKAGVLLVDHDLPSIELIKRASLTLAITGTATFEALLLNRPSLLLAKTFFYPWVTHFEEFEGFDKTMRRAMEEDPAAIHARALDCVSRVLAAGHDFVIYDPHTPDYDPMWVMNRRNIDQFLTGFNDHLNRMQRAPVTAR